VFLPVFGQEVVIRRRRSPENRAHDRLKAVVKKSGKIFSRGTLSWPEETQL
jgi:hypothetical protein